MKPLIPAITPASFLTAFVTSLPAGAQENDLLYWDDSVKHPFSENQLPKASSQRLHDELAFQRAGLERQSSPSPTARVVPGIVEG